MQGFRETGLGGPCRLQQISRYRRTPYLYAQDVPSADLRWSRWHIGIGR